MGWKVVDHDNPMVAQSPLLAGRRQQISLTLARTGSGLRCSIKPTRVWVKGLARVPYKAHTIRMRLNAFERAVLAAGGGPVSSISGASAAQHNPLPRPVPSPSPPTPSAPTGPSVGRHTAGTATGAGCSADRPSRPSPSLHPRRRPLRCGIPRTITTGTRCRGASGSLAWPHDHDGHTVVRSRGGVTVPPTPPPPAWTIHLDTGEMHRLDRPTLLGRSPIPKPGEAHLQQVVVTDPSLTVSKTHLLVEVTADGLVVTDRGRPTAPWCRRRRQHRSRWRRTWQLRWRPVLCTSATAR